MRTLCTSVALALCSSGALAADFGIGVSARSDDAWIYAPIDIGKVFRLEPSVRYASNERRTTSQSASRADDFQKTEALEFGVGIFGLARIAESAQLYYGGRFAYVENENTVIRTLTFSGTTYVTRTETHLDGYRVGPALGVEYEFGQHFSVGGEVSYTFFEVEGDTKWVERKTSGTTTQLIFRYIF